MAERLRAKMDRLESTDQNVMEALSWLMKKRIMPLEARVRRLHWWIAFLTAVDLATFGWVALR